MPMFVTVPTPDLADSTRFWCKALGFVELFTVPGTMTHLRRWAFQDVLLVSAGSSPAVGTAMRVNFACVAGEVDQLAEAVRGVAPEAVEGPTTTAWNSRELEIRTPEGALVVMTAALPHDGMMPDLG